MYIYPYYLPCKMTHTSQRNSYPNINTFVIPPYIHLFLFSLAFVRSYFHKDICDKYLVNSTLHPSFLLLTFLCLAFFFSHLPLLGIFFFLFPSRLVVLFCDIFKHFPFFFSVPPSLPEPLFLAHPHFQTLFWKLV